jgi:hypothetical protein
MTLPPAVQSGLSQVKKPTRWFMSEGRTRVNYFFSSPSWAHADHDSPHASATNRSFFIFIAP